MPLKQLRNLCLALVVIVVSALYWSPARAEDMTCPEHTPVTIDIKPGSYPNSINLSSKGLLPVAVLSTASFDVSLFQTEMAHLTDAASMDGCSGATAVRWQLDDVNRDGNPDLVFFFRIQDLGFSPGTTAAIFMAHGVYNGATLHIMGTDSVRVTP